MNTCLRIAIACLCVSMVGMARVASSADAAKPPKSVGEVDEFGENFYDYAKAQKWDKAAGKLAALKKEAESLAAELKDADDAKTELAKHVAVLEKAVADKDQLAAMRASNQLTRLTAKLSEAYPHKVPTDIAKIDFLGREVEIWAVAKDDTRLKSSSAALQKTWKKVRPAVVAKGAKGKEEAKKVDGLISKLKAAKSPDEFTAAAGPILDAVDDLEDVFK
jgi:hypothetical protein